MNRNHARIGATAVAALGVAGLWAFTANPGPAAAGHHIDGTCEGLTVSDTPLTEQDGVTVIAPVGFTSWADLGVTTVIGWQNAGREGPKTASRPDDCVAETVPPTEPSAPPSAPPTTTPDTTTTTEVTSSTTTTPTTSPTVPTSSPGTTSTTTAPSSPATTASPPTNPSTPRPPSPPSAPRSPAAPVTTVGLPTTR